MQIPHFFMLEEISLAWYNCVCVCMHIYLIVILAFCHSARQNELNNDNNKIDYLV